jgi:peptidoglycan hydrolase-like protein with peptidoglycan-binding domain
MESPQAAAREPYGNRPPAAPRSNEPRIATAEARDRELLTAPEIKELQQFLREAGYRVWADGIPGDQTERALSRWQRIRRLPDDARFDRASLEMLRHAYGARGGTDAR